mmetsp:Transcript_34410/g.35083  ORF Transcript_34410/g.35083 Transcript_34410/m.35083 type:complete len:314 (-) Transcript_34410:14-955(-)
MSGFPFHSSNTFLKVGSSLKSFPFAIAGIAFDGATTNRPGARFGPRAIRDASHMLFDGLHPHFNISPTNYLVDYGDLPLPNTSLANMRAELELVAKKLFKTHHMVWLGGDHSITLSLLRAHYACTGKPVAVLHFDAHCDAWTSHMSEPSGHGTWVREAVQEGLVLPSCFTQIGLRSSGERVAREYISDKGGLIFPARDLRGLVNALQLQPVLAQIKERLATHNHPPVYLTLDIDCLDPSYAPGTGTPEVGGLSTAQVLTFLEELGSELNFVSMDCVEVSPPYDHAELTSHAAATFIWTYLCARIVNNIRVQKK